MAAPDPYNPQRPVPGKPIVKAYPTPDLRDRVFVLRKDSRAGGYVLPEKGASYDGPEAQKLADFFFATAVPSDQTGWVDHYYLNKRANEDAYNYAIEYPYADKDYPQVIRTYVLLRSDVVEPEADSVDPIYTGEDNLDADIPLPNYPLLLVEHKQLRLEDPILDSLFVGVQRVYERLPSPVITSYNQNEVKQVITIETQEVEVEAVPESSATTEVLKVERTTTAKARVTTGTVPNVFPRDLHAKERPDLLPPEFRGLIPNITEAETIEGDAVLPTLDAGDLRKSELQETKFTKRIEETRRDAPVTPAILAGKEVTPEQQIATVTRTYDDLVQTITGGPLVIDGEVIALGDGTTAKRVVTDPAVFSRKVFEVERPDLLPPEFRGVVPTTSTEVTSTGTAAQPVLGGTELRRRSEQLTLYRKREFVTGRGIVTLPKSFYNQELGGLSQGRFGEGFTGVLTVTWTLAAGIQAIDGDILTTEAEVRNLGDGSSVKIVKKVDGYWPTLRERIVDPDTGVAVNITKKVIPILTAGFGPIANGYVDVRAYDKWRSIQITSKVDLTTLPAPETFGVTTDIALPASLVSVNAEWLPQDHFSASHSNLKFDEASDRYITDTNNTQVLAQSTVAGTIVVKLRNGYRGPARGRLVRTYLSGPPGPGSVPSVLKIEPSTGQAFLRGTHLSDSKTVGFGVSAREFSRSATFDFAPIGPCLVGIYSIGNKNFLATPVQVTAASKGFPEADAFEGQGFGTIVADDNIASAVSYPLQTSVGGVGELVVAIDASNPSVLYSGMEFLQSARVTKERFGIWVQELVYVTIP